MVIHIARSDGDDLVLKQVREQLKVAEPWYCSVDRIWREVDVLRICATLDPRQSGRMFPSKLKCRGCCSRIARTICMPCQPHRAEHVVWKHELLSGMARSDVARSCGTLLGTLHAKSWHDASLAQQLDDRQFFDDLRLDPYYRQIAGVHESLAPDIERLIDSVCERAPLSGARRLFAEESAGPRQPPHAD